MMPENVETLSWVMKTVWQQIPGRRACNSKTPTTITAVTVQSRTCMVLVGLDGLTG